MTEYVLGGQKRASWLAREEVRAECGVMRSLEYNVARGMCYGVIVEIVGCGGKGRKKKRAKGQGRREMDGNQGEPWN